MHACAACTHMCVRAGTHAYGKHSLPACRALVQRNAQVNEPDSKMRTPLLLAYQHAHVRVAHYLWDHGAEPERSYGLHNVLFKRALLVRDLRP
jgi:ankyrin repeat protein